MSLSPASVRNVMSDLEELGLIYAPHISAGRLPTQTGLRFFVDAFMQVGHLSLEERAAIERQIGLDERGHPMEHLMTEASRMLSGVSRGAGIVITAKSDPVLKHVEFIRLGPPRRSPFWSAIIIRSKTALSICLPVSPSSQLTEAANFLNAQICQDRRFPNCVGSLPR